MPIGAQKAQGNRLEKGTTMKTANIDFTKAIVSGKLTFEQACALQGATMTQAIQEGILTFEEACELQGIAVETSIKEEAPAHAPKAPKKPAKKQAKAPKAEEPKAEVSEEPKYTKGGLLLQWDDGITAKGKEKATITKGYNSLTKQGFTVTRKRVGTWVEMYQSGDEKRPSKEFAAAKLDSGWKFIKGAWKYPALLDGYEDSFRPEK